MSCQLVCAGLQPVLAASRVRPNTSFNRTRYGARLRGPVNSNVGRTGQRPEVLVTEPSTDQVQVSFSSSHRTV